MPIDLLEQKSQPIDLLAKEPAMPDIPTSPLIRTGRGFMDVGQGLKQLYLMATNPEEAKNYQKKVDAELDLYEQGKQAEGVEGMDWYRLGGNVAATAPVALVPGAQAASLPARMASGAAQGSLAAGSLYTPEGESKLTQTAAGAVGGAAVPVATKALARPAAAIVQGTKRTLGRLMNSGHIGQKVSESIAPYLDDAGVDIANLSDDMQDELLKAAKQQLKTTGKLDGQALARKAISESIGFTDDAALTTGQVTRSPKLWAKERNLSKIEGAGDDLLGRFENQNQRFMAIKDELSTAIKSKATTFDEAGENIYDSVLGKWKTSQQEVGKLYKQIGDKYGSKTGVDLGDFVGRLDDLSDDLTADSITGSVLRRAKRLGLLTDDGVPSGQSLTVDQSENLRKFIGKLADGRDPNLMRVKGELIDSLDDGVIDSFGDDVYKAARDKARERFTEFGNKTLKRLVQDKIEPSKLVNTIMKSDPRDLAKTKASLTSPVAEGMPPEGAQAWEDMRQQVVEHLWDKATAGAGVDGTFSGAAFNKAMKTMGDKRLAIFFSPEELATLRATAQTGRAATYAPPYSAVNWSNTAPAGYNLMQQSKVLPLMGDTLAKWGKSGADRAMIQQSLAGVGADPAMEAGARKALAQVLSQKAGKYVPPQAGSLALIEAMRK